MKNFKVIFSIYTILQILILTENSFAYFTTGESAELVKPGQYHLGIQPQIRLTDGSGFNFDGFIDAPFGTDGSVRAELGFGETDFMAGLSYKWIPIPDYGNQPAIGGKVEALYARRGGQNINALRLHVLASKAFDTDYGAITGYTSIPLSLVNSSTMNDSTFQLVGGAEYKLPQNTKWMFGAEIGLNLTKSFNYISGTVTYLLDEDEVNPARKKKKE